ncbi:MAG: hypothetical protein R2878_08465 [Thermoleophilia bacterium]
MRASSATRPRSVLLIAETIGWIVTVGVLAGFVWLWSRDVASGGSHPDPQLARTAGPGVAALGAVSATLAVVALIRPERWPWSVRLALWSATLVGMTAVAWVFIGLPAAD